MHDNEDRLVPLPHIIKSIRSKSWNLTGAISELVDNSLGHGKATKVQIHISNDKGIAVLDDGIGVDDINRVFRLGDASSHDKLDEIGQYGIGSKDATIWLGDQVMVRTVRNGRQHKMVVDWAKVERDKKWPLRYKGEGVEAPAVAWGTEIHITKPAQTVYHLRSSEILARELGYLFSPAINNGAKISVTHVLKDGHGQKLEVVAFTPPDLTDEVEIFGEIDTWRGKLRWSGRAGLSPSLTERHNGVHIAFGHRIIERANKEAFQGISAPTLYCEVNLDSSTPWKHALSDHKDKVVHFRDMLMESIHEQIADLLEESKQQTASLKLAMFTAPIELALTKVLKGAGTEFYDPEDESELEDGPNPHNGDKKLKTKSKAEHFPPKDDGEPAKPAKPHGVQIQWAEPGTLGDKAWNWEINGKSLVIKLDKALFADTVDYPPNIGSKVVVQLLTSFISHAIEYEYFNNEVGLIGVITPKLRRQLSVWMDEDERIAPPLIRVFMKAASA